MLAFPFDSSTRFIRNELVSSEEPGKTARAPVERRQASAAVARKRRRDDALHSGKRAALQC